MIPGQSIPGLDLLLEWIRPGVTFLFGFLTKIVWDKYTRWQNERAEIKKEERAEEKKREEELQKAVYKPLETDFREIKKRFPSNTNNYTNDYKTKWDNLSDSEKKRVPSELTNYLNSFSQNIDKIAQLRTDYNSDVWEQNHSDAWEQYIHFRRKQAMLCEPIPSAGEESSAWVNIGGNLAREEEDNEYRKMISGEPHNFSSDKFALCFTWDDEDDHLVVRSLKRLELNNNIDYFYISISRWLRIYGPIFARTNSKQEIREVIRTKSTYRISEISDIIGVEVAFDDRDGDELINTLDERFPCWEKTILELRQADILNGEWTRSGENAEIEKRLYVLISKTTENIERIHELLVDRFRLERSSTTQSHWR